ncbi:MAG TPA: rhodanese-like domain-containing protein [Anaerolineales bacterium]|nr:rhodanese-like domain-containing protein [Anaerolineales bacterium]
MNKFILSTLLLATLLLSACSGNETASQAVPSGAEVVGKPVSVPGAGTYTDVSVPELQTMLENKDFTFVNVHIPFEGDIPATDLSIPYDEIEQHLEELPADKGAKIVLYCRSDRMSNIAAEKLVQLGYTNVWNLEGGFNEWGNAGLPLEK